MGNFALTVDQLAKRYEGRMRAIVRTAVQETVSMAQRPKNSGGHMPIQTGFLRASIQAAVHSMPSGPSTNQGGHGGKRIYGPGSQAAGEPVPVALLNWNPNSGDPLFVGWTANYARAMESKYGFMRLAAGKWDSTVKKAVRRVESTYG